MSERLTVGDKIVCWYYIVYSDLETEKVIRKIPYKLVYFIGGGKTSYTVYDTKKFKIKGNRRFSSGTSDDANNPWSCIEIQGFEEGWYDPRKVRVHQEPSSKNAIKEKYSKYNEW